MSDVYDQPPRAYEPWEEWEDRELDSEWYQNRTIEEIARNHGRSKAAIEARLLKWGLINKHALRFWDPVSKSEMGIRIKQTPHYVMGEVWIEQDPHWRQLLLLAGIGIDAPV